MSLLGIYLKKVIIRRDTCTPMFLVALFTIAKTWKQPKCPSTDKYMKILYIYTMEYYLALKKNEIMALTATCSYWVLYWTVQVCLTLSVLTESKHKIQWYYGT